VQRRRHANRAARRKLPAFPVETGLGPRPHAPAPAPPLHENIAMSVAPHEAHTRRTQRLSRAGLQIRLASRFVGIALAAMALQAALVTGLLMRHAAELGPDAGALAGRLPDVMLWVFGATFGILVPLMLWLGILLTHRTAGPLDRIEAFLVDVIEGVEVEPLMTRKNDELKSLAELINETVQPLLEANRAATRVHLEFPTDRGPEHPPLRSAA